MTGPAFVDTNVLVYRRDQGEQEKQPRAELWLRHLWERRLGRLSVQVLKEFYVTVTQKLVPGIDRESARSEVRSLFTWRPVPTNVQVMDGAWRVQDRFGLSFWDSLIVSAAQLAVCRYLLSEDLQDGLQLGSLEVVDPFRRTPDDLD
jgi:predicted nucleic acid-binding protein